MGKKLQQRINAARIRERAYVLSQLYHQDWREDLRQLMREIRTLGLPDTTIQEEEIVRKLLFTEFTQQGEEIRELLRREPTVASLRRSLT
ncbi:MAG TPA: hypothetical protein VNG90_03230 [Candidatus Acidoferrum sp.]|nr:hypothetical protein [Candidatus Acidoferrum sp.]